MLVAMQLGKHASIYFIFGIFSYMLFCFYHLCYDDCERPHIIGVLSKRDSVVCEGTPLSGIGVESPLIFIQKNKKK